MSQEQTEQEAIEAGHRVEAIVKDEVFAKIVAKYLTENFRDFKKAKATDEILAVHARSVAMQDFMDELQGVIDHGEAARIQRKSREEREAVQASVVARRKQNAS